MRLCCAEGYCAAIELCGGGFVLLFNVVFNSVSISLANRKIPYPISGFFLYQRNYRLVIFDKGLKEVNIFLKLKISKYEHLALKIYFVCVGIDGAEQLLY